MGLFTSKCVLLALVSISIATSPGSKKSLRYPGKYGNLYGYSKGPEVLTPVEQPNTEAVVSPSEPYSQKILVTPIKVYSPRVVSTSVEPMDPKSVPGAYGSGSANLPLVKSNNRATSSTNPYVPKVIASPVKPYKPGVVDSPTKQYSTQVLPSPPKPYISKVKDISANYDVGPKAPSVVPVSPVYAAYDGALAKEQPVKEAIVLS